MQNRGHYLLRFVLDSPQMLGRLETFGVNFVDILGTGRARGEPAVLRDDFDSANGVVIAGRGGQDTLDFFTGQLGDREIRRGQLSECRTLAGIGGRVDSFIKGFAMFAHEFGVNFRRSVPRAGGDLGRKQRCDDTVFIGAPHRSIAVEE